MDGKVGIVNVGGGREWKCIFYDREHASGEI